MKRILTIIGARPQIIKAAAISRTIRNEFSDKMCEILVHTGQHYDSNMSETFFEEMGIPRPDYNLGVGSGNHGAQTAQMIEKLETIFLHEQPDGVLVYGDTNSTLSAAIAAVKLHIPIIHVEAGLRSYNKSMPEEINRIMCDHASTLLFSPTTEGIANLEKEGFDIHDHDGPYNADNPKVYHCGDVMFDNSMHFAEIAETKMPWLEGLGLKEHAFILATVHRDHNTDVPERLKNILAAILRVSERYNLRLVFPIHPRTSKMLDQFSDQDFVQDLRSNPVVSLIPPASFLEMVLLEKKCSLIITDSGGVQKEAFFFKKPCVILRPQTEWVELVKNGNALLADADPARIEASCSELLEKRDYTWPSFFGDGRAASFICKRIMEDLN